MDGWSDPLKSNFKRMIYKNEYNQTNKGLPVQEDNSTVVAYSMMHDRPNGQKYK